MKSEGYGSKSDLSRTSFGNTPTEGLETIDAYDDDSFSAFATPVIEAGKSLADTYNGIKPNLIMGLKTSAEIMAFIQASEYKTIDGILKALSRWLPEGISINDILEKFGLEELLKITNSKWLAEAKNLYNNRNSILSFLDEIELQLKAILEFDINGEVTTTQNLYVAAAGAKWVPSDTFGGGVNLTDLTGNGDYISAALTKYGLAKQFIASGNVEGLVEWIKSDPTMPEELKKWLVAQLIAYLAAAGLWEELAKAVAYAGNRFTPAIRIATIQASLGGYYYPAGVKESDKATLAATLIANLNTIDVTWYNKDRNGETTPCLKYMSIATDDAIDLLKYNPSTSAIAVTQAAFNPFKRPYAVIAHEHYPYLSL